MSVVALEGVKKAYGPILAVAGIDLAVQAGEFVTLLGPSGCGKTTTLRMIAGFVKPSAGSIVLGGRDVTAMPPHRREIGLVFQSYALFPHMTVAGNVEFGLKMRGVPSDERRRRVAEALDLVRLGAFPERYPGQLSGGQQQRVALARALVIRPTVLLLDEPFGALDKQLRDHMRVELRDLQKRLGIATIFVTHDQEEAMAMSDRICVMANGVAEQIGPPADIYERPASRLVADFMGRSNLLDAQVEGPDGSGGTLVAAGRLRLSAAGRAAPGSAAVTVMIRPERIALAPPGELAGAVPARVRSAVYLGATIQYEVELATGQRLAVTRPNEEDDARGRLRPEQEVGVVIPPSAVYLIEGR